MSGLESIEDSIECNGSLRGGRLWKKGARRFALCAPGSVPVDRFAGGVHPFDGQ